MWPNKITPLTRIFLQWDIAPNLQQKVLLQVNILKIGTFIPTLIHIPLRNCIRHCSVVVAITADKPRQLHVDSKEMLFLALMQWIDYFSTLGPEAKHIYSLKIFPCHLCKFSFKLLEDVNYVPKQILTTAFKAVSQRSHECSFRQEF